MTNQTLAGLFSKRSDAEAAVEELKLRGIPVNDISLVAQETVINSRETTTTAENVAAGAGTGTATGATVGGLLGLLVGLGALTIPGIGALFIAGPIAAALGLTGTVASTVSGALTGALAGGLVGALMGLGFTKEDAEVYERRIKAGDVLVAVTVRDMASDEQAVRNIFDMHHAQEIRLLREPVQTM